MHAMRLPQFGSGMFDGEVMEWLVKEGDAVTENQELVEIETSKVTIRVPTPVGGTLRKIVAGVGTVAKVGDVIAYIGDPGEALPDVAA